ncbi:hypothetical protein ACFQOY_08030 [Enterococcus alcedinis]|uniref:hypothetical protein n=1 Tax=Enterococcus alcedinis TaxID=1274384 RepID=UPI00166C7A0C|nr:hypothetical protein [Enterococcus alcedinis]MBP2101448.1 asparagine N-glycosylation enzyme membrane subunit Stt3 [Enterococcus alcedinis]
MKQKPLPDKYYFYPISLFGLLLTLVLSFLAFNQVTGIKKAWFLVFQVFIGVLLCLLPFLVERRFKLLISSYFKKTYWLFLGLSVFLGTGLSFYLRIRYWDKMLHAFSGMVLTILGLGVLSLLMPKFKHLSTATILLFSFFFAMTLGVYWEFYEFTFDGLLGLNMQQFATITGRNLVGRHSLMDTMSDLFANALGASLFTLYCAFKMNRSNDWLQHFFFISTKEPRVTK